MSDANARDAIFRTLTWFETLGYAPTRAELMLTCDLRNVESQKSQVESHVEELIATGAIMEQMGRIGSSESIDGIVSTIRERDVFQPRKRRAARVAGRWLARLAGVRFVALANTTALGHARDEGDLDFFIVARAGTIWLSRLLGVLPFRLLGLTPKGENDRDAVCLSYFVADDALDLSSHQLPGDDPYFRYWFLSLLPLFDDGVSQEFWGANAKIRERHPFAEKWIVPPDLDVSRKSKVESRSSRRPTRYALFEPTARWLQMRWFPRTIRERMNRDTTVIVTDHALKFHVTDGREKYRRTYQELCEKRNITP